MHKIPEIPSPCGTATIKLRTQNSELRNIFIFNTNVHEHII